MLSISLDADSAAVRVARNAMSLATHPDKNQVTGAPEAFMRVTEAALLLMNDSKRATYARDLAAAMQAADASARPHPKCTQPGANANAPQQQARSSSSAGATAGARADNEGFWARRRRAYQDAMYDAPWGSFAIPDPNPECDPWTTS